MPEVAANAAEAVLQDWPIAENTPFSAQDTIATVETEKAVVDIEAESDGVLLKTLVPAGSTVEVGAPIAVLGDPGEKVDDLDALLRELGVAPVAAAPAPEHREVPDTPQPTISAAATVPTAAIALAAGNGRIFASPLARRMAREAGIPVEEIRGTGPGGRIIRRDVEAAIAKRSATAAAATASTDRAASVSAAAEQAVVAGPATSGERVGAVAAPAPAPAHAVADQQPAYVDQPHSRMRKAIAIRLTESKQTIPHFYLRGTARVDKLLQLREQLNQVSPTKISVNDMVIKAAAAAHLEMPAMNVIWTPEAVRSFSSVDISVAVATERGLVTPVLRGVERLTISQIAAGVKDFVERAKAGRLQQHELEGGSLSITNLGMYGTEEFAAIINPPQAAILAVGAARQEPVVEDGQVVVGTVMRVTLSVDHRPVDGVVAAQWMRAFLSILENPLRMLV
jgi:pyruvate dehydrogenase E2 component (dihydrolipoamide acetyltransferase)